MHDAQRHPCGITDRLAMGWPRVSRSLKAMMNMDSPQWRQGLGFCQVDEQVQQDSGVESTGVGDMPGRGVAPGGEGLQEFGG
ncbi:hypothetical protein H097_05731 [Pseudomonas sp. FH4]|nr:hypothetical protein H097_05731 [Pseudomonas sp. FH4]